MSISERAIEKSNGGRQLVPQEMKESERSIVEKFRLVALKYVDADAAASLMEELKSTAMEERKSALIAERGDMADNKAERLVKSSPDWRAYITEMCRLRSVANKYKLQLEVIRMEERQMDREYWHGRSEAKMGRSAT
jgi:hypothetical protein